MIKPWLDPSIATSIQSGTPLGYIDPTIRRRILDKKGSEGYDIANDISLDIDALSSGSSGGSSGGGSYVAKAVTFAANAQLAVMPSVPDSSLVTISFWQNISQGNFDGGEYWVGHEILLQTGFLSSGDVGGWMQKTSDASILWFASDGGLVVPNTWRHIFFSGDTNHPAGQKIANMLLDGTSVLNPTNTNDASDAFTPSIPATRMVSSSIKATLALPHFLAAPLPTPPQARVIEMTREDARALCDAAMPAT